MAALACDISSATNDSAKQDVAHEALLHLEIGRSCFSHSLGFSSSPSVRWQSLPRTLKIGCRYVRGDDWSCHGARLVDDAPIGCKT